MTTITFIGGGNMARALLSGLVTNADLQLRVADPGAAAREAAKTFAGVQVFEDNMAAIDGADCVVLAVKPQLMQRVCEPLKDALQKTSPLVISVAAGIECAPLQRWLGDHRRIVRAMPNTPALVGYGATGLFGPVSDDDRDLAELVFSAVGIVEWVDKEALIDAVTALSGSGPAYFFYILEAMQATGIAQGLSAKVACRLAQQTALGAARMALASDEDVSILRQRVTSPGGTTEAAVKILAKQELPATMTAAMNAASARAAELSEEFGRDATSDNKDT